MSKRNKSGTRPFRQATVYRWLLKHGPATVKQATQDIPGVSGYAVNQLFMRLMERGCAIRGPQKRNKLWTAIPDRCPEDMRGTAPGTLRTILPFSGRLGRRNGVEGGREGAPAVVRIPTLAEMLAR